MAEEALKRLEEQLNCSICLDTYTDPKLLQCFHVFCQQCLVPLGVRDQQGQLSLTCPTCRQVTPIPTRGVAGLQSAFHINHLLEIQQSLKKIPAASLDVTPLAEPAQNLIKKSYYCPVHDDKELELFCETCKELICYKCVIKDGKHHSHDYSELNQAFERYKEEISLSLEPMEKQAALITKALAQLDQSCREISDQRVTIEDNIHITFRNIRDVLNMKETELISQLDQMAQTKLKDLAAQKDSIETSLVQLSSCLHFIKESLKTQKKQEMLAMKAMSSKKAKELTTSFQIESLKPCTEADMILTTTVGDLTASCQSFATLLALSSPDPQSFQVTGKGLEAGVVGKKSIAFLQAIDIGGNPCKKPIGSLECELLSRIRPDHSTRCHVEQRGDGKYEISYQPMIKGRHKLHIKVEGKQVTGSPFKVDVSLPPLEMGAAIRTLGGLQGPYGVAISQRGRIVVTESDGCRISIYSITGKKIRSFIPICPDSYVPMRGVAVDGEGNIIITVNNCIQKFTAEGQFLTSAQCQGLKPIGVAFNVSNDMLYVVDRGNSCIQVLNSNLKFSSPFGKKGSGKGQLNDPDGIACDDTGNIYVADTGNHRIQVFTAGGKFASTIGRRGQDKGGLYLPSSVAVDNTGMMYISEGGSDRVSVFTSEGLFVTTFGERGFELGEFHTPRGVAVDKSGVVYVCDHCNNRLQLF